jgi:hypothetical protein
MHNMKTLNLNHISWGLGQKCPNKPAHILVQAQNNLKTYPRTINWLVKRR